MTDAAQAAVKAGRTPVYSWVVLAMLCFVYVFNFMDRQLMSVLGEEIKGDLGLTDTQLGQLTGLYFALFYTFLGVAAGWLADKTVRVRILAAGCFIWSLFTLLCGRATTFPVLAVARMGVGVGEAAGAPPSYSIVSDYFPAEKRGLALALFSLGVPFGMAFGAFFGPTIAEAHDWRLAFIIIGIAGMIASVLLLIVVREPKRGAMDAGLDVHMEEAPAIPAAPKESFGNTVNQFFGRPLLLMTALACGFSAFVGYAVLNWTVPFLTRVQGADYGDIRIFYSLMLAVSMGLGTWLSGAIVDKLVKRGKIWYALLPAGALALSIPAHIAFVYAPTWQLSLAALAIPTFLNIFYLAPALAVVQNSVRPGQRTMAGALLLLVLNLIGLGGGPTMVGMLSDNFAINALTDAGLTLEGCISAGASAAAECGPAQSGGLQTALFWLTPFYVFAVLCLLAEAWTLKREDAEGAPAADKILRNASIVKILFGGGGLVLLAVNAPLGQMFTGLGELFTFSAFRFAELMQAVFYVVTVLLVIWGVMGFVRRPQKA